jgi:hypothetical protein
VRSAVVFHRSIITLWLGLILWFYLWTASSSGNPFTFGTRLFFVYRTTQINTPDYYNMLTDAFLSGRLSLLVEPSKELLSLPDPYDPSLNEGLRMHDASLYNGKYYAYWGLTPALVLFIPFRVIFHKDLPDNLAVALFCFGGLVWSVLLLNLLIKPYFTDTPFWMRFAAVSCLSLSNVAPYILRRPAVYEVAIASGYFFLFGGLYWLLSGVLTEGRARSWQFSVGSLFLGLAVGSRPHYVFAGVLLPLLWWKFSREKHHYRVKEAMGELACLSIPFFVCVGLLGLYNYARFGSWTEFGQNLVLAGRNVRRGRLFSPHKILPSLFRYSLAPSQIDLEFPFFHLPKGVHNLEPVAGILANIPFINILFLFPLYFSRSKNESNVLLSWTMGSFVLLAIALVCIVSSVGATMRYVVDVSSLLLVPALLLWFYFDEQLSEQRATRHVLRIFSIVSIVYGCAFNVAISMTGPQDLLKSRNPETYRSIEAAFVPLKRFVAH